YKAEGSKLMAYGVGSYTETNPVTLTIKAPADAMFNGDRIGVTLEGQSAWTAAGLEVPTIYYDGITAVPSMLGNHVATISAGGATASLNYEITSVLEYQSFLDGGLKYGTNYDIVSGTGKYEVPLNDEQKRGVYWDETEQCAVFDGEAYLKISNPLGNANASTGFTITMDVYISSQNNKSGTYINSNGVSKNKNGWQRIFDLSDGTIQKFFVLNAGAAAHLSCIGTTTGYGDSKHFQTDLPNATTYYDAWHTITLVVAPGGNITLYVDKNRVSFLATSNKVVDVLNKLSNFNTCFIGTSVYEDTKANSDGFFFGKMRGFQVVEGPLMPYYDGTNEHYYLGYETNGGNVITGSFQTNLPNPLPTPTHTDTQKKFAGWYLDAIFTTPAVPGAALSKNTTLYAKWDAPSVYTRDVTNGSWGTLCLPWESVKLEGGNYYDVLGTKHAEYGVALVELDESDQLTAGKPYVFKATSSQIKVTYNPATGVDNPVAGNHIIGSFADCNVPEGMYIIYNNLLYITDGSSTIGANRAYFDADNMEAYNPATAPARVVFMGGHQTPTDNPSLHHSINSSLKVLKDGQFRIVRDGKTYNAQGQRIQ
ncbi:MAG: InlB B-repeat-containing protein, partial [Paludibacteraceae bacterium]|nr:InlB B-repeat-containing protein [Paludibacteraceae bacterium]